MILKGITFNNVPNKKQGTKIGTMLTQSNITVSQEVENYIQSEDFYKLISALDIDWAGIEIDQNTIINDTADLINWIKSISVNGGSNESGDKGPQGDQGPAGIQGTKGVQGPQGLIGTQGIIGSQGVTGVEGPQGITGDKGMQGDKGIQGAKGEAGVQGLIGVQGEQGAKGEAGDKGAQGEQGQQGVAGTFETSILDNYASKTYVGEKIAEVVGAAPETLDTLKEIADKLGDNDTTLGQINTALENKANTSDVYSKIEIDQIISEVETIKGDKGDQGEAGAQGVKGDQGEAGAQGVKGDQGEAGVQGVKGDQGEQGPQGETGSFNASDLEDYVKKEDLGTFGEESEYDTFDYIYNEDSWNNSFANGVLKKYYTKYPDEDLWNPTAHRAANFNDKAYEVSIYNDANGENLVKEGSFKAAWASANAQKITNASDANESYYLAMFYAIDNNVYELFTDVALTTSANLYVKMTAVSFPGCTQCWEGAIQAPGAKFPWICPNFETDANVMIKFQYEGKEDVAPWNFSVFGKGPGHKEWGIASVATEFGDDSLAITENGGQDAFDITKFKVITVNANANIPAAIKAYIDVEIAKLKAQIG